MDAKLPERCWVFERSCRQVISNNPFLFYVLFMTFFFLKVEANCPKISGSSIRIHHGVSETHGTRNAKGRALIELQFEFKLQSKFRWMDLHWDAPFDFWKVLLPYLFLSTWRNQMSAPDEDNHYPQDRSTNFTLTSLRVNTVLTHVPPIYDGVV